MRTGDKSPEVKDSVEDAPVVGDGAVVAVSSDLQPPVIPQLPPPLAVGQPGLMAQPPLLHSPIAYQPPMMQSIHPVPPLPHIPEQIVKEEPKGPRPVKSIPVAGTPWSVVWSSDNRRFFFNATNRMSVWNIPEDLETNPFIHKILEETAEGKSKPYTIRYTIEVTILLVRPQMFGKLCYVHVYYVFYVIVIEMALHVYSLPKVVTVSICLCLPHMHAQGVIEVISFVIVFTRITRS